MKKELLSKFKKLLLEKKELLISQIEKFAKKSEDGTYEVLAKDYGSSEDENAEEIEDMIDEESTLVSLTKNVSDIDKAMEKIEEGSYGTCTNCGELIEEKRLEFNISSVMCSTCQTKKEKGLI